MRKNFVILFCALFASRLPAQTDFTTAQSFSKQFIVRGPTGTARAAKSKLVVLDPALLAVSCDRIKQTALAELYGAERTQFKLRDAGEGKFFVVLHPGVAQAPLITPIRSTTLSYRVDLPGEISGARLIETITEAVLLELVNRRATETFTQVPGWLSRGLAEKVQTSLPETLVLQGNQPISRERVQKDFMADIRKKLSTYSPLTFEELSWPETLAPDRALHFDDCAHLFVQELLRLPEGRASLARLMEELPRHLNWQIAFLRAFDPPFQQLVDVEKWWSLKIVTSPERAAPRWTREQALPKLRAALRVPVQQFSTSDNPNRRFLTLQEVVADWEPARQKIPLQKVLFQLRALRLRMPAELTVVADDYAATLENYLKTEEKNGFVKFLTFENSAVALRQSTRERLGALDHRLAVEVKEPKSETREQAIRAALDLAGEKSSGNR